MACRTPLVHNRRTGKQRLAIAGLLGTVFHSESIPPLVQHIKPTGAPPRPNPP
jgi:hypothetical protein